MYLGLSGIYLSYCKVNEPIYCDLSRWQVIKHILLEVFSITVAILANHICPGSYVTLEC